MKLNRGKTVLNIIEVRENILNKSDKCITLRKKARQDFFVVGREVLRKGDVVYVTIHTTFEGCGEQFPTSRGVVCAGWQGPSSANVNKTLMSPM